MDHDHHERALSVEANARLERERSRVSEIEVEQPLRRPILSEFARLGVRDLGVEDLVATDRLRDVPRVEIMAALLELEDACCLCSGEVDGATRWSMTAWGECELNRHRAFGATEPPPPPLTPEETEKFLEDAFDRALFRVLPAHGPEEAAARLRAILREARKIDHDDLASRAEAALTGLA